MRKKRFMTLVLASAIFTSGCDHYSTKMAESEAMSHGISQISPASGGNSAAPSSFSGFLANEYYTLAKYENDVTCDYVAARKYLDKAEALSGGQMVGLSNVDDYKIEDEALKAELQQAQAEISNALVVYRTPENRWALAVAQSRFDCWLDEAEEGKEATTCKAYFKEAMNKVVVPMPVQQNLQQQQYYTHDNFDGLGFE